MGNAKSRSTSPEGRSLRYESPPRELVRRHSLLNFVATRTGTVQFNQCEFERDRTRLGPLPEGSYDVFVRYGGVRLGSWPVEVAAGRTNSLVIEIPQLYDVEILTPPGFHELHSDVVQCFLHAPRVHLRVPAGEYLCSRIGVPIGVGNVTESTTLNFRKED